MIIKKFNESNSSIINIEKLKKIAESIQVLCAGEYGDTYYHPEKQSIFICLGDSNPFDLEYLKQFILDGISSYKDQDKINIEIENECCPDGEGWLIYKNSDFIKN